MLQKNKTGLKNKVLFLVAIIILVLVGINLSKSWRQSSEINEEIVGLGEEIQNLEKDNLNLKELIQYFNSTAYIEEKARVDLGLKKEGEKVIIVANPTKNELTDLDPLINHEGKQKIASNPQKWWRYFFK